MSAPEPRPRHLFFDLDGTLTNPAEGITRCIAYALESLGEVAPPLESLTRFIGPSLGIAFRELLDRADESRVAAAISAYRERYGAKGIRECTVIPGIRELLRALEADGSRRLCVVTAKPTVYAEQVVEQFGLTPHFEAIYGPPLDLAGGDKQTLITQALEEQGIAAGDAWMIGDREHDVLGARACGVTSVGVTWGFGSPDELREAGATHIVTSPAELGRLALGTSGGA
jgi:phosphoglycolate phosphatase